MIGTEWKPSEIENTLYDIMKDYEISFDLYEESTVSAITDYFSNYMTNIQWQLDCSEWPDMTGGSCFVSFVDNCTLHMIGFDFKKK